MRPDHAVRQREAEAAIEDALRRYGRQHEMRHVLIYVAHIETETTWNELQSRAGETPRRLSEIIEQVEGFLRRKIEEHVQ